MPAPKVARFGSVSSGTMRTEDLLDAFADELECLDTDKAHAQLIEDARKYLENDQDESDPDGDIGAEIVDEMFSAMNEFAPPFGHFGAHPGDGADYGFWFSEDCFNDAVHAGEVVKVDAGDEWPDLPDGVQYVAEVTDHGNLTLYTPDHSEVWSLV